MDGRMANDPARGDELAAALGERPEAFAAWAPMVLTMAMGEIARR